MIVVISLGQFKFRNIKSGLQKFTPTCIRFGKGRENYC